jgi:hypothetical protein
MGWHSVNTNPADQLPAFTDGEGILASGLTGLLNDFPASGHPAKRIEYALPAPAAAQTLDSTGTMGGTEVRREPKETLPKSSSPVSVRA